LEQFFGTVFWYSFLVQFFGTVIWYSFLYSFLVQFGASVGLFFGCFFVLVCCCLFLSFCLFLFVCFRLFVSVWLFGFYVCVCLFLFGCVCLFVSVCFHLIFFAFNFFLVFSLILSMCFHFIVFVFDCFLGFSFILSIRVLIRLYSFLILIFTCCFLWFCPLFSFDLFRFTFFSCVLLETWDKNQLNNKVFSFNLSRVCGFFMCCHWIYSVCFHEMNFLKQTYNFSRFWCFLVFSLNRCESVCMILMNAS